MPTLPLATTLWLLLAVTAQVIPASAAGPVELTPDGLLETMGAPPPGAPPAAAAAAAQGPAAKAAADRIDKQFAAADKAYNRSRVFTVGRPAAMAADPSLLSGTATTKSAAQRSYLNMRFRYFQSGFDADRPGPGSFIAPATADDLAKQIKALNRKGVRWVPRSGGHSYAANSLPTGPGKQSGKNATAVVDLAKFQDLEYEPATQTVRLGGGVRLGQVYALLAALPGGPRLLVAGTCPGNGASGFLLGGGVGQYTRRLGWGSQQVVSAKVVSPEGVLMVASEDDGTALLGQPVKPSELLWALRGGGAGSGVVYEWRIRTYPTPSKLTRCMVAYNVTGSPARFAQVIAAVHESWRPWQALPGNDYPVVQLFLNLESASVAAIAWDKNETEVQAALLAGLAPAAGAPDTVACRTFSSWAEYVLWFGFESYGRPPGPIDVFVNTTQASVLGWEWLGFPSGRPPALSPRANFAPSRPPLAEGGPRAFYSPGLVSTKPWTNATAAAMWDAMAARAASGQPPITAGTWFFGGAVAAAPPEAIAQPHSGPDVICVTQAGTRWFGGGAAGEAAARAATAAFAAAHDAAAVAPGRASRFYNFLMCDKGSGASQADSDRYYEQHFGANSARLKAVKAAVDPNRRTRPWCDV